MIICVFACVRAVRLCACVCVCMSYKHASVYGCIRASLLCVYFAWMWKFNLLGQWDLSGHGLLVLLADKLNYLL